MDATGPSTAAFLVRGRHAPRRRPSGSSPGQGGLVALAALLVLLPPVLRPLLAAPAASGALAPQPTPVSPGGPAAALDPLPSWREGESKRAILRFVARVSGDPSENGISGTAATANRGITPDPSRPIPAEERIAVFDNDGTLWSEQPLYTSFLICIDRIRGLAPQRPEWRSREPWASALRSDLPGLLRQGSTGLVTLLESCSGGLSSDDYRREVRRWFTTARHPRTGLPYARMVYQPMLELLALLRDRGFRIFIVTGGDGAFVQAVSESVYGIPASQVLGTRLRLAYRETAAGPVVERLPTLEAVVDGAGKPEAIEQFIGRRPVAAFGNSDGDLPMLRWTMAERGPRLALLVHHTDGLRERAYDANSPVGRLDQALTEARARGWIVVDMARDWLRIHPGGPQLQPSGATGP